MKIPAAKLSIVRKSNNGIVIEISDDASRLRMIEIKVTPEQFALALTGMSEVPCEGTFNDSGKVGMNRENKQELIFLPDSAMDGSPAIAACVPFEVDGWLAHYDDMRNSNRIDKASGDSRDGVPGRWYRVTFVRYVGQPSCTPP